MSVKVEISKCVRYAIVSLCKEPVNSMNLDLWKSMADTLTQLESNPKIKGMILCSALKKDVFTAGNDLLELYAPKTSRERFLEFWKTQNVFLARLLSSRLVTVAAIKGACPAGGCCTSLCCDFRIMTSNGSMGLNEVALGITVPDVWAELMANVIGHKEAERLCCYARMVKAKEAKSLGLIDQIVENNDALLPAAQELMEQLLMVPDAARARVKWGFRQSLAKKLGDEKRIQKEAELSWTMLSSEPVVKSLSMVVSRLSSKI